MSKPRTPAQQEAARQNGSKSQGRNRPTHGQLSKTIVLEGEEAARFATLLLSLRNDLQPTNALEESLVEDLAICRWRQRRLLAMETACLSNEIRHQTDPGSNAERAARAYDTITRDTRTLDLINRHELRFTRQFNRTLRTLQQNKKITSNPGSA